MLIQNEKREFKSNVDNEIRTAQILTTPTMFKILSDQLYSDKELAILRELVSNAWDAHVAAGTTDKPMKVHLPTSLEEWFEVKDYGTGLSQDDVYELYMNYGASNKQHTNELIGGFGIGSKSPFCYTDQFSVESRYQGTKYFFQAFIQENGSPGCMLMGQEPTSEDNGLTIRVPVKNKEGYHRFTQVARDILPNVPTKPECNLDVWPTEVEEPDHTFELYGFEILAFKEKHVHQRYSWDRHIRYGRAGITIVQGIVPYDASEVVTKTLFSNASVNDEIKKIARAFKYIVKVPTGTFDVSASREGLSLDDSTIKKLANMFSAACKESLEIYTEQIKKKPSWWDRAKAADVLGLKHFAPSDCSQYLGDRDGVIKPSAFAEKCQVVLRTEPIAVKDRDWIDVDLVEDISHIFISPKKETPYRDYLREDFFQNNSDDKVVRLVGDFNEIERVIKKLNLPVTVKEFPTYTAKHKPPVKFGRTIYAVFKATGGFVTQLNADGMLESYANENKDISLALVPKGTAHGGRVENIIEAGLTKFDVSTSHIAHIQSNHNRVSKDLGKHLDKAVDCFNENISHIVDDKKLSEALALQDIREEFVKDMVLKEPREPFLKHLKTMHTFGRFAKANDKMYEFGIKACSYVTPRKYAIDLLVSVYGYKDHVHDPVILKKWADLKEEFEEKLKAAGKEIPAFEEFIRAAKESSKYKSRFEETSLVIAWTDTIKQLLKCRSVS